MNNELPNINDHWLALRQQLYYFVLKRVGETNLAEDIVQEVLVKVYASLDTLKDKERFIPWMYQIARNAIVDYYRRDKPSEDLASVLDTLSAEDMPSAYAQLAPCMLPLIEQLPTPYREAILWSEIEGITQQEVAERMGISLSGAKSQVQRGRKKLKVLLLQCCQLEFESNGRLGDYQTKNECNPCTTC